MRAKYLHGKAVKIYEKEKYVEGCTTQCTIISAHKSKGSKLQFYISFNRNTHQSNTCRICGIQSSVILLKYNFQSKSFLDKINSLHVLTFNSGCPQLPSHVYTFSMSSDYHCIVNMLW